MEMKQSLRVVEWKMRDPVLRGLLESIAFVPPDLSAEHVTVAFD